MHTTYHYNIYWSEWPSTSSTICPNWQGCLNNRYPGGQFWFYWWPASKWCTSHIASKSCRYIKWIIADVLLVCFSEHAYNEIQGNTNDWFLLFLDCTTVLSHQLLVNTIDLSLLADTMVSLRDSALLDETNAVISSHLAVRNRSSLWLYPIISYHSIDFHTIPIHHLFNPIPIRCNPALSVCFPSPTCARPTWTWCYIHFYSFGLIILVWLRFHITLPQV